MDISIIVPIYNVARYLPECLDSILIQDFSGQFEVICVNDGSTDESSQILEHYSRSSEKIRVIHQDNKGLSATRNVGIDIAKGKYILFIDSDDYLKDRCVLEIFFREAENNHLDITVCKFEMDYKGQIKKFPLKRVAHKNNKVLTGSELLQYDLKYLYVWNKLYKRSFVLDNGLYFIEGIVYEDCEYTPRAYVLAERVKYVDRVTYCYRKREGSITKQKKLPLEDILFIADRIRALNEKYQSGALLDVELWLYDWFIFRNMRSMKDKEMKDKCKLEMKKRGLLRRYFSSDRMYFKIYPLAYCVGFWMIHRKIKKIAKYFRK